MTLWMQISMTAVPRPRLNRVVHQVVHFQTYVGVWSDEE